MGAFAWERYRTRALDTVGRGHVTSGTQSIAYHKQQRVLLRPRSGPSKAARPREKKPALKKALNLVESFKRSWWLYRG